MKIRNLFFGLTISSMVVSCSTTKTAVIETVISPTVNGKALLPLYSEDMKDSSLCSIDYRYFYPTDQAYKDTVNKKIVQFTSLLTQFDRAKLNGIKLSPQFFKAQLDSFAAIYLLEDFGENRMRWELEGMIEIDDTRTEIVQLQTTGWTYTGGAHGNGATYTYIFEKKTGKELKLEDFFSNKKEITAIGESYFRKLYGLGDNPDLNDAGFWFEENVFYLNNNFSIVGESIVFLYNSYEIAPYSGGQTVLEIPIEEIKHLIKVNL